MEKPRSWRDNPKYRRLICDEPEPREPRAPRWSVRRVQTPEGVLLFEQAIVSGGHGRRRTLIRGGRIDGRSVDLGEVNGLLAAAAAARKAS